MKMKLFRAVQLMLWLGSFAGVIQGRGIPATPSTSSTSAGAAAVATTYFFTDPGGSYSYAYRGDNGLEGQQSANDANEVTGHYSYYENGIPYLVRYTAGVNGYRPQVFVASQAASLDPPNISSFADRGPPQNKLVSPVITTTPTTTTTTSPLAPPAAISRSFTRSQPLQVSQSLSLSPAPGYIASNLTPLTAFSNNNNNKNTIQTFSEIHVERAGGGGGTEDSEQPEPYSFSYNSDLSSHSESGDKDGHVAGKYSYVDEAGYHDVAYKADAEGFSIVGGSLATPTPAIIIPQPQFHPQRRNVYHYNRSPEQPLPAAKLLTKSSLLTTPPPSASPPPSTTTRAAVSGRSLRKFRRYTKW